jgi:hypothetical protein
MKKAMVNMWDEGLCELFPLYLTVHDEIDFGVPKNAGAILRLPDVQRCMERTFPLSVPMRVDPEIGRDWGHMAGQRKEKKDPDTGKVVQGAETLDMFLRRIIGEVEHGR